MNKKLIFPVAFVVLVSLAFLVSADIMTREGFGPYEVTVGLIEGWNIVAGTFPQEAILEDSDLKLTDIKAVWSYVPKLEKYYQVYPTNEFDDLPISIANQIDEDEILTSAMWIYSEKRGSLRYSTLEDYLPLPDRKLYSGWNFVTVTPEMANNAFEDMKGSCDLEGVYEINRATKQWDRVEQEDYLPFHMIGIGVVIKVSDDCSLGFSTGDVVFPPSMPSNEGSSVAQLRTAIEGYYYDEFSYEECDLNNYQSYSSKQDCEDAISCLASEFKELIPEADLQGLADYMAAHGGENGYVYYITQNPDAMLRLESKYDLCLGGRHEDF